MAESLFDNRYRYDYIYPRGRSGETLRAVDSQAHDRPVVIKRPAPNDAPPIRAGQEVSIVNERRALSRLSGHPVLTELLGGGQFTVGGMAHQYIVVERAEGQIVADVVLELAKSGDRLPELEMLVIVDRLLDLLVTTHQRDIVYNDVDAKHLFWDRDNYRLKVIDWGNAVFLEGDDVTPQGVSRQSDIFQVGELLYFILTGGGRLDVPREAGEDFQVQFGGDDDDNGMAARLRAIISKAVHPNPRLRYVYITELRRDLSEVRSPLERERDAALGRIAERLRRSLSKTELQNLLSTLDHTITNDPGSPAGRQIRAEILERMRDLDVSSDMDVVMIYMESANWGRAVEVLGELRDKAGSATAPTINLLLDCAILLVDSPLNADNTPQTVLDSLALMFEGRPGDAAQILLTHDNAEDDVRRLQWLLAERVSSHVVEVLLLRPNLYRLESALASLAYEGIALAEPRTLLGEVSATLDGMARNFGSGRNLSIAALRDRYRDVVDRLTTLNTLLSTVAVQHNLSNRKLPLSSLDRALNAAMALADNMHVIGKQATASPRDALGALDNSRAIDPTSPAWDAVAHLLNDLYRLLGSYQTYVPAADGADLENWLRATQNELQPFMRALFDEMLTEMSGGLSAASRNWEEYAAAVIQGDRATAINTLTALIDAITLLSPTLAGWLNQLRAVVEGANYVERHAIYGGLGRALADGWEAFDRSRLPDAERLGGQAGEIARNEREQFAARRLRDISRIARDWVERNLAASAKRTEAALEQVEALLTADERKVRDNFSAQMPSKETFLRAMNKGIVEIFGRSSTAANRILAVDYVLRGTLEAHAANLQNTALLDDAVFWREAAVRALGDHGPRHMIVRMLDEFIERRRDLNRIAGLLNGVSQPSALDSLDKTRRLIEENPQAKTVSGVVQSLRDFESALREWAEGEFRAAGLKLENALGALTEAETGGEISAPAYRTWLEKMQAASAELYVQSRAMRAAIEKRPVEPDNVIRDAHHKIAQISTGLLGDKISAALIAWRDTYERFLAAYLDPTIRRSAKLERFNELFRAMFIDRHPAYSLYRFWYEVVETSPEFPAPPTDDPTPRIREDDEAAVEAFSHDADHIPRRRGGYEDDEEDVEYEGRRGFPRGLIVIVVLIALIGVAALVILPMLNQTNTPGLGGVATASPSPESADQTPETTMTGLPGISGDAPTATLDESLAATNDAAFADFSTPTPPASNTPTTDPALLASPLPDLPTDIPLPTDTATATMTYTASPTFTPSMTFTPSITPTITASPTATLPPNGLQGQQNLLALLPRLPESEITWTFEQFSPELDGASWRLGEGAQTGGDEIVIPLSADVLETFYGNNAAGRVRRFEAGMNLLTYDPSLPQGQVYFGLSLRSADGTREAGVYVEVVDLNTLNLYRRIDGELELVTTRTVNTILTRLRIDRDTSNGLVRLHFNDDQLGDAIPFGAADAAVIPALFVKDGGVVVNVPRWQAILR